MTRHSPCLLALLAAAMLCSALAILWPALHGGFIFDDLPNLVDDPDWKLTTLEPKAWLEALKLGLASGNARPLAMLSFAINHYYTLSAPLPMKATSLGMHLLNASLVFLLCRKLFTLGNASAFSPRSASFAALIAAFAWTVHPLQISTVFYVIQRMELGSATGTLLALICYLNARCPAADASAKTTYSWWIAAGAAALFGLGFKETAILIPGYCLLIEVFLLRFRNSSGERVVPLLWAYAMGLTVALVIYGVKIFPEALQGYGARDFTPGQRLLTQTRVLMMYLGQMALPLPERLHFYYDDFTVSKSFFSPWTTAASATALSGLLAISILARDRLPLVGLGIAWFFLANALTSNVIPLELAFEHRNYLALLGFIMAATQLSLWLTRRLTVEARIIITALPLCLLCILSAMQAREWSSPVRIATTLAARAPQSVRANYELGRLMYQFSENDPKSPAFSIAVAQLKYASGLPSSSPLPEQGLIIALSQVSPSSVDGFWRRFDSKLADRHADPDSISALYGLLDCKIRRSCNIDDARLEETFQTALDVNPNSAVLHSMYANFVWNLRNDHLRAIDLMKEAVELEPENPQFRDNLRLLRDAAKNP